MKSAFIKVLIPFVIMAACCVAQAAIAGEPSPCQGVNQNIGADIKDKADLERTIVKQINTAKKLKVSSVDVLRSFASGNWSIVYVNTHVSDEVYLFYSGNPLTSRYVTHWAGAAKIEDEPIIRDWALKNAPGIPPKLASCFARHVTLGY